MDLVLAAILVFSPELFLHSIQDPPPDSAQDPQAAFEAWLAALPAEAPRPLQLTMAGEFGMRLEDVAVNDDLLGDFEQFRKDAELRVRYEFLCLDSARARLEVSGRIRLPFGDGADPGFDLRGQCGILLDGPRVYGWADLEGVPKKGAIHGGVSVSRKELDDLFALLSAGVANLIEHIPEDADAEAFSRILSIMPATLSDYLHPSYFVRSLTPCIAREWAIEGEVTRGRFGLPQALTDLALADVPEEERAEAEIAARLLDGSVVRLSADRESGVPLEFAYSISMPLEAIEAAALGTVHFEFSCRTLSWSRTAPDPAAFVAPEGYEWFDMDPMMPAVRLLLASLYPRAPDTGDDEEF
jgi:hypothetical protein